MELTKKEKELLLRDLCARLPYGVKFACSKNVYIAKGLDLIVTDEGDWEYAVTAKGIEPIEINFIKPYLRPMSSMTEEEKKMYCSLQDTADSYHYEFSDVVVDHDFFRFDNVFSLDYLNSIHVDYRDLIPKGLALEASEGMYNK